MIVPTKLLALVALVGVIFIVALLSVLSACNTATAAAGHAHAKLPLVATASSAQSTTTRNSDSTSNSNGWSAALQSFRVEEINSPIIEFRENMGTWLEQLGLKTGAELGVQDGWFAKETLARWKSCTQYLLVDVWAPLTNYVDTANRPADVQEQMFQKLKKEIAELGFDKKASFMRMLTVEAASKIADDSLDFIYIDARHDYCGCRQDMDRWWPKLKVGGVFAGHDFVNAAHARKYLPQDDWAICENGERREEAVRGAVLDFAKYHNIKQVYVIPQQWKTWYFQKPKA